MSNSTLVETTSSLALHSGPKAVNEPDAALFRWPIVTEEDEKAVLDVLRAGAMSNWSITKEFENEWGAYLGTQFNLAHCNGTMALLAAMYGVGVGRGDEVIAPSLTYWASAIQTYLLGATPVFADLDPESLTIDPKDIERRITPRTKAIVVVHYCGHPADMDPIMAIARKHQLKVIEDLSHAQGALYKGRKCGTIGDVAGISMMSGKSFAIGEGGMLSTNSSEIHQRAIAFCHYERIAEGVQGAATRSMAYGGPAPFPLPIGGLKGRLNQTCSAMGRVQLKHYPARVAEIQRAMNRFWDLLEGVPGLRPHRPAKGSGSTMGGWYNPLGHYLPEELGGLSVDRFAEAVRAEGVHCCRGGNLPLHLHPLLNTADVFNDGKPTRIAFATRDLRQPEGSLPVSEGLGQRCIGVPWFKHDHADQVAQYAAAFRKVAENADRIIAADAKNG